MIWTSFRIFARCKYAVLASVSKISLKQGHNNRMSRVQHEKQAKIKDYEEVDAHLHNPGLLF